MLRFVHHVLQSIEKVKVYSKAKYNPVSEQSRRALRISGGLSYYFEDKDILEEILFFIMKCLIEKRSIKANSNFLYK